jgi:hypothetical protein
MKLYIMKMHFFLTFVPHSRAARFFSVKQSRHVYQMTGKYTKCPQNIPDGLKIFQMAITYIKNSIPMPSKIYQN